jgi:hypothetical protein
MSHSITITNQDLIQQLKLSGKVPEIVEGIIARKIITETATAAGLKTRLTSYNRRPINSVSPKDYITPKIHGIGCKNRAYP